MLGCRMLIYGPKTAMLADMPAHGQSSHIHHANDGASSGTAAHESRISSDLATMTESSRLH